MVFFLMRGGAVIIRGGGKTFFVLKKAKLTRVIDTRPEKDFLVTIMLNTYSICNIAVGYADRRSQNRNFCGGELIFGKI